MNSYQKLREAVKNPEVKEPELIRRVIAEFMKMKTDMLYHNSLVTKARDEPYRDFCLRRIRLMLDISPESSGTVYELLKSMLSDVSYSRSGCLHGREGDVWLSSYTDAVLLLSRINNRFVIKREESALKGGN